LSEERRIPPDDEYWTSVSTGRHGVDRVSLMLVSSGSCPNRPKMSSAFSLRQIYAGAEISRSKTLRR
jgi:hypothetical protein